jgi:hypothetical protein
MKELLHKNARKSSSSSSSSSSFLDRRVSGEVRPVV